MNSPRMSRPVRPDVTAEQARDARAAAWSFAFDCFARKKAVEPAPEPDGHDDAKEAWLRPGGGVLMGGETSVGGVARMRGVIM